MSLAAKKDMLECKRKLQQFWGQTSLITATLYRIIHDDVIKLKHFPRYRPFVREIHRSPVNSPHKGDWRGAVMFSLICVWINGWVNNREAGGLRRYRAHYDVIVMFVEILTIPHRWTMARAGIQHRSIRSFKFVVYVLIKLRSKVYQQSIEATLQQLIQFDLVLRVPDPLSNVEKVRLTVQYITKYTPTLSVSVAIIVMISSPSGQLTWDWAGISSAECLVILDWHRLMIGYIDGNCLWDYNFKFWHDDSSRQVSYVVFSDLYI